VPQTGRDYPGSHTELLAWFPDEAACLDYLEWLRWPDGFRCPRCVSRAGWRLSSGRWECAVSRRQASVTSGTIFHRTRTPLRLWFAAAWEMTTEAWCLGAGHPAVAGAGVLPDGVGDAASLPQRDGPSRPRATDRSGRGRRGVSGRSRRRGVRPADRHQGDRRVRG
jgi:hypothetical protein